MPWIVLAVVAAGAVAMVLSKKKGETVSLTKFRVLGPSEVARLAQLEPTTQAMVKALIIRCAARGVQLYLGSAGRSDNEQKALIAKGVSTTVTRSWHESRRAMDIYPIDPATKQPDMTGKNDGLFRVLHAEWFALGGQGLAYRPYPAGPKYYLTGAKGKIWDGGHVEFHGTFKTPLLAYQAYTGGKKVG